MKKTIIISTIVLTFLGCSSDSAFEGLTDDSSFEATMEEAAIALDNEDYNEVINLLAEYYTTTALNPEVARLLVSGYMGKAGIDVTAFITYSTDVEADNYDSIDATLALNIAPVELDQSKNEQIVCNASDKSVLILDGNAVYIDGHCIEELIEHLDNAKEIIYDLQEAGMETIEDMVQLGITSAVHYVFIVGSTIADALNITLLSYREEDREPGLVWVPINKEAYEKFKTADRSDYEWTHDWENKFVPGIFGEEDEDGDGLTRYQEDLININDAINSIDQAIQKQNNITDELDEFLREVIMMPTGDISNSIIIETATTTGIFEYVDSI